MAASKIEFDWSILDREYLKSILWELAPQIVNFKLTSAKIHTLLRRHIQQYLPIKVTKKMDPAVDSGWIYVGGTYYSDYDRAHKKCIEVIFCYNMLDEHLNITKSMFKRICKSFADVILHEIIHMRQYRRRKFKIIPDYESNAEMQDQRMEQSYLGCTDEIDAYSFNIACELLDKFPGDQKAVVDYIIKKHHKGRLKSHSLRSYLKAFDYNTNHPIIKRLKKKIIRYLPKAELGKPYKTTDWINH